MDERPRGDIDGLGPSHRGGSVTGVTATDAGMKYRVRMDGKRRPTLPAALLDEAGIDPAHELVAYADGHGRVVLEDPTVMLCERDHGTLDWRLPTRTPRPDVDLEPALPVASPS